MLTFKEGVKMSRKILLPALLTTALVVAPGMLHASAAKPCQSGFFLSAGVGMVNHGLKLTKSADQVKANAKAAFEGQRDDGLAKIAKAETIILPTTAAGQTAIVTQLRPLANNADVGISAISVNKNGTGFADLPEAFIKDGILYIINNARDDADEASIASKVNSVLGLYKIQSVKVYAASADEAKSITSLFTDADKPKFEDAKLADLSFRVADKDITLYQTSNGKEVSTYTSPKGVAFQLMGGYRHTLGNNMAAALAAYFGFGLGNGRNSKAGETEELKTKERFHYGLELHLGAYVTPTTFLFAKGVIESTSFKFANYNKVGTQTKPDTKDGHAHTTHFRPGMGVGMTTNIQNNLGVGIDYTYLFNSGGKDLKVGGSDAAGTEMKVGRIKGDTHRVMLRLVWTI